MNRKPQDKTEKTKEGAAPANGTVGRTAARSEEIKEESDYADVAAPPDQRCLFFTQPFPLIAVCWLILLVIMGPRIYFTAVISENNARLTAENQELKILMIQNYTVIENKVTNLTEENLNLATQNKELKSMMQYLNQSEGYLTLLAAIHNLTNLKNKLSSDNENLRRSYNNLTIQLNNLVQNYTVLQNNWNELNVTQAQWSIDAYCPKENNERLCTACPVGWIHSQTSCYAINVLEWKTWEEAQENCRGKSSHLAVVLNQQERNLMSDLSWNSSGTYGYWIGLRAEGGRWKWVDGNYMTYSSWIEAPAEGRCAVSVQSNGWKSVSCGNRNRWICKKKALSV